MQTNTDPTLVHHFLSYPYQPAHRYRSPLIMLAYIFMLLCITFMPARPAYASDLTSFYKSIAPSGQIRTERREVTGFSGVALAMSGRVEIKQGSAEGVTIETDDNIIPLIQTVIDDGILHIRWKSNGVRVDSHNLKINITVNAISINRLSVTGSGTLYAAQLQTDRLAASMGGSGSIHLNALKVKKLVADIGGSGSLIAQGSADIFLASIGGSGGMRCAGLQANDIKLSMAGSGNATVWARDALAISMAGSGNVEYYGNAKVSTSKVGKGSVRRLGAEPR